MEKMGAAGALVFMLVFMYGVADAKLVQNFYSSSCPLVESIVKQVVVTKISQTFVTVPATLRLFFHDCFVKGCDASIMIQSSKGDAEKDAPDNLSLAGDGFDTVIKAKQAVEAVCPGVVSCADVLAIAARDVVSLSGGPFFNVELGRLDGLVSLASNVPGNLPQPDFSLNLLSWIFRKNNLTEADMVALSGAHTLGFSHCSKFSSRLYNFSSSRTMDPTLNPAYAQQLMSQCPQTVDPTIAVQLDPVTSLTFDNVYYKNLVDGKGLLTSDQTLFSSRRSRQMVRDFAANQTKFFVAFASAMVKLGRLQAKTGSQGEIRSNCAAFNA
ncbi:peroxidase 73-like [Nymphaea colorata]|nr:peroxidase 73-like [Nymphaea colorata]